ncbi:MAG: phenylalanine--tRNA ligase subunit beta [Pyrinomonadaceae bacterium]|nr:phenylalanine--tRNA ligase subunit beta [Pyrinomonadaceae bacterium]
MNISYNWLRELTGVGLKPRALAERLTMLGLAVDGVHERGDDFLLEIDLTSNRPDCLSHLGVAREVAVEHGGALRMPAAVPSKMEGRAGDFTAVEIEDEDLCPRYAGRVVRGVQIGPSPEWLVKRLEVIGQRAINNVADITNYVMHEMGQPLHAFDLQKLSEHRIVVRRARSGERLRTLDGVDRELQTQMLVIADASRAVALAGIMGGEETEISNETRDVLIESAYFDPSSVRRTARALGLHTEASYRFERGTDYEGVLRAQERAVALICELAGGAATEDAIDVYPRKIEPQRVSLRPSRVEALTGLRVETSEMRRILSALGFIERAQPQTFEPEPSLRDGVLEMMPAGLHTTLSFTSPTWRVDIEREEDLVEEVARHAGYDGIAALLPPTASAGEYQPREIKKRALRRQLTAFGYDEAINFSFIESTSGERLDPIPKFATLIDADAEEDERAFVTLTNPIIEGMTRMRPTLLQGLLQSVRRNFNHGTRNVRLFETGIVFAARKGEGELPFEREALALVATGGAVEEGRAGDARELDFYDLKGAVEAAVDAMGLPALSFAPVSARHLRVGQAAVIMTGGQTEIGTIGRLSEEISAEFKFRQPVYVAELDLAALLEQKETPALYTPLSRFPSVVRDLSLLTNRRTSLSEMLAAIRELELENLSSAQLVDVYEGANLPEGKRSVTLRLEYRAEDRTLRDEEADEMHTRVVQKLAEKFGAEQRV